LRVVQNRVETSRGTRTGVSDARLRVARRPENRSAVAKPIVVFRQFQSAHLRVDMERAIGDGIKAVGAQDLIKRVADVDALDVTVAGPAEIVGADAVWNRDAVRFDYTADRRRTRNPLSS
jgi:hypothetical protein